MDFVKKISEREGMINILRVRGIILLLLVSFLTVGAFAAEGIKLTPDAIKIVKLIVQLDREASDKTKVLWEGYSPIRMPLLVYFDGLGTVLFNHPNPPADFHPLKNILPEISNLTDKSVLFRPGPLKEGIVGNFGFLNYNDNRTAIYNCLTEDKLYILIHEMFHAHQFIVFNDLKMKASVSDKLAAFSAETLASMYLEQVMLAHAIMFPEEREEYIRNFIALRSERYLWEDPGVIERDSYKERIEGTARYIEKAVDNTGSYKFARSASRLLPFMNIPSMYSNNYYETGNIQLLLLEGRQGGWQKEIEAGKSVFEVFKARADMKGESAQALVKKLKARYDFSTLVETAAGKNAVEAGIKDKKLKYFHSPQRRRVVMHSCGQQIELGSLREYWTSLDERLQFDYKVELSEYVDPKYGNIHIRNAMMEERRLGGDCLRVEVLLDDDENPEVAVDGERYVPDSSPRKFKEITLHSNTISLALKRTGTIAAENGKTTLNFNAEGK